MIQTEREILDYLSTNAIPYVRSEHPPVFTCEEAARYRPAMDGLDTKNLFLRDEKRRFYLAVTACEKRLDMKALGKEIGAPKLRFASEMELMEQLGLTPGSVTILALVNDRQGAVQLLVDDAYWPASAYLCHPMVNTATLVMDHTSLGRFLEITGHKPQTVVMPERV